MTQQEQVEISQQLIWGTVLVIMKTQERLGEPQRWDAGLTSVKEREKEGRWGVEFKSFK